MPNHYTLSVAVRTCTVFGYVDLGVQIHGLIVCVGLERDEFAGSSLLDFYFKVMGDLGSAFHVFDGLYRIDVVTWNVMISGLAQDGDTSEVLRILSEMQVVDGLNPNDSTIVVYEPNSWIVCIESNGSPSSYWNCHCVSLLRIDKIVTSRIFSSIKISEPLRNDEKVVTMDMDRMVLHVKKARILQNDLQLCPIRSGEREWHLRVDDEGAMDGYALP
ncbi:hypothetical protein RJ640_015412 [Escallonia rubra]|uniref:Pentatricopeptide repeat-containing protein n=1 Tax=Escallonia rubra TaxID=112253 RepID=A0AA88UWN5_9ASTE|nr:hypothetical protein RJ640_015412 [Escallonia rubra]